jgi:transposase
MTGENDSRGDAGPVSATVRTLRQYPLDLKRRMVEETFAPGSSVSIVARRHDVNANLLFDWRKKYREGRLGSGHSAPKATPAGDLVRIGVIENDGTLRPLPAADQSVAPSVTSPRGRETPVPESRVISPPGIIEIELPNRVKVRVDCNVGEEALRRILAAAGAPA